ncbi:MAG: sulfurtransferase TusA family protein [Sphingomonas fennica]
MTDAAPRTIDARGMRCPWPAIRLARALREGGGPVLLLADDPAAGGEAQAVAAAAGWRIDTPASAQFLLTRLTG